MGSGLPRFPHERPSTWYSGDRSGGRLLRLRGYHPLWPAIPGQVRLTNDFVTPSGSGRIPTSTPTTPAPKRLPPITRSEFGLFPFRSPLLRELFPFLQLLRCFSSLAYLSQAYLIQPGVTGHYPGRVSPFGYPWISACSGSPEHFVACHVLHRLLAPRHPPRALCSLTFLGSSPRGKCVDTAGYSSPCF